MGQVHPVDSRRIHISGKDIQSSGPVIYWMSRDQRVADNWALLYAQNLAVESSSPLGVVFCLAPEFLGAPYRHYDFMLTGLEQVAADLEKKQIPFFLLIGDPVEKITEFVRENHVGAIVTDFSPLHISRRWKDAVAEKISIPVFDVDTHNIVPCRHASPKAEYGAYTIRPKILKLLPELLTSIPAVKKHPVVWPGKKALPKWSQAHKSLRADRSVGSVSWLASGEKAAHKIMKTFLDKKLAAFNESRNDPTQDTQSNLSPYLHFGQISAQRIAYDIQRHDEHIPSQETFLEQLIVRRELSDNFCFYNDRYDSFEAFPIWAQNSLNAHRRDIRPYLYDLKQFETAQTHDDLWNAAQLEMVVSGKMHGYMRMYWAKKILEWSRSPEDAMATAIYLNDTYSLDGRDPNGYAGIAWSIGGVHDRPWFEREIIGKIRYMSYDGCRRKFDIAAYIARVESMRRKMVS